MGAIAGLTQCAESKDLQTLRGLAFGYVNICSNPANHVACERLGLLRPIISLLQHSDKDVHLPACLAVRHLCETPRCRNQFLDLGGVQPLLALGKEDDVEVRREVAAAMRNLSLSEPGMNN